MQKAICSNSGAQKATPGGVQKATPLWMDLVPHRSTFEWDASNVIQWAVRVGSSLCPPCPLSLGCRRQAELVPGTVAGPRVGLPSTASTDVWRPTTSEPDVSSDVTCRSVESWVGGQAAKGRLCATPIRPGQPKVACSRFPGRTTEWLALVPPVDRRKADPSGVICDAARGLAPCVTNLYITSRRVY